MIKVTNIRCFALAILVTALPCVAHAYSGAGGECGNTALESAAVDGRPADLEKAIDTAVVSLEKVVSQWGDGVAKIYPGTSEVWRNREVKNASTAKKREIFAQWWECRNIKLLDLAVAGRNMPNVEYLLALGVDPNARSNDGSTVLMRCPQRWQGNGSIFTYYAPPNRPDRAEAEKVQAIYSRLIRQGASMSRQDNSRDLSALHLCNDMEAIEAFIKNGADFAVGIDRNVDPASIQFENSKNQRVIDFRIKSLFSQVPWERQPYISILERLVPLVNERRILAKTERDIAKSCKAPQNAETCVRLATMITPKDTAIFNGTR